MDNGTITMALRGWIEAENAVQNEKLVIVLPSEVMVDMAKEADRTAITKVTRDADGATHYEVVALRDGVEVTAEITGFLADLRTFRFIEPPRFPLEKPRPPKLTTAERMAQLRRFAGQDWRGRR